jgi:LCP family protein required for cell wall assembly
MVLIVAGITAAGATGVIRAADARTADVERIDGLEGVLADAPSDDAPYPAENYLLVGSDTREGLDLSGSDAAVIGDTDDVSGRRSDTIMILRQERNGGAALMSIPRDLWIEIAGTGERQRINTAYNAGPERLAATVSQSLGIPVHHYVEVDFQGFKDIVDEIGGVDICVMFAARDRNSGLDIQPGCTELDGTMALAYARSRYYEEWIDGQWVTDPRADLGRIERQQLFIRAAVDGLLADLTSSPFGAGDVISAVVDSVRIDPRLDPVQAADTLRRAAQVGLRTYALPVENDRVGDAAVLRLGDGAEALLAYFRGDAPPPIEFQTGGTAPTIAPTTLPGGDEATGDDPSGG